MVANASGLAMDESGNLYASINEIAPAGWKLFSLELVDSQLRRLSPAGEATVLAGDSLKLGALPASLGDLSANAVDGERLYIATRSAVLVVRRPG